MMTRTTAAAVIGAIGLLMVGGPAEAQSWRTMESARQLQDREHTSVKIEYGAGTLRVEPAEARMLYRMELRYDEDDFRPITEFDAESHTLRLGAEGIRSRSMNIESGSRATIALTREAPLDLDLDFGAGEAELELGGMRIRRLDVSTGASETTVRFGAPNPMAADRISIEAGAAELNVIGLGNARARRIDFEGGVGSTTLDFTGAWTGSTEASVQMGIGELTLRFPEGLGVKLERSSFLTSFDTEGLIKRGDAYYSPDWESAEHRVTLNVNAAFGAVNIRWVRPESGR